MSKAKEHIICEACGKSEWHDHCIVCDKDLGQINCHNAIYIIVGRRDKGNAKDEFVCSVEHLKEYVNGLTEQDLE